MDIANTSLWRLAFYRLATKAERRTVPRTREGKDISSVKQFFKALYRFLM